MKKILIIEDETNIRESVAELLEMKGYGVTEAENGDRGVQTAFEDKPDLILCDIMMPGMNGHDVLTAIRNKKGYASIPFIFLTALSQKDDIRKGMNLGADDYLVKPFKARDLYEAIETRLARQEEREKESVHIDPFRQDLINTGIVQPIQGLKASSATLLKYFNDYTRDEIISFVQKLNISLDKIERTTRNLVAAQAIELSAHDEEILQKLTSGYTADLQGVIRPVLIETATSFDRASDIFIKSIPEFRVNLPEMTLRMIIAELFFNAFKFSEKGRLVSVEGEVFGDELKLTITDEGSGMDPELVEMLNNDELMKNPQNGKYGLYVVKSLLHKTNNSLIISSNKNEGTTVNVLLK